MCVKFYAVLTETVRKYKTVRENASTVEEHLLGTGLWAVVDFWSSCHPSDELTMSDMGCSSTYVAGKWPFFPLSSPNHQPVSPFV